MNRISQNYDRSLRVDDIQGAQSQIANRERYFNSNINQQQYLSSLAGVPRQQLEEFIDSNQDMYRQKFQQQQDLHQSYSDLRKQYDVFNQSLVRDQPVQKSQIDPKQLQDLYYQELYDLQNKKIHLQEKNHPSYTQNDNPNIYERENLKTHGNSYEVNLSHQNNSNQGNNQNNQNNLFQRNYSLQNLSSGNVNQFEQNARTFYGLANTNEQYQDQNSNNYNQLKGEMPRRNELNNNHRQVESLDSRMKRNNNNNLMLNNYNNPEQNRSAINLDRYDASTIQNSIKNMSNSLVMEDSLDKNPPSNSRSSNFEEERSKVQQILSYNIIAHHPVNYYCKGASGVPSNNTSQFSSYNQSRYNVPEKN